MPPATGGAVRCEHDVRAGCIARRISEGHARRRGSQVIVRILIDRREGRGSSARQSMHESEHARKTGRESSYRGADGGRSPPSTRAHRGVGGPPHWRNCRQRSHYPSDGQCRRIESRWARDAHCRGDPGHHTRRGVSQYDYGATPLFHDGGHEGQVPRRSRVTHDNSAEDSGGCPSGIGDARRTATRHLDVRQHRAPEQRESDAEFPRAGDKHVGQQRMDELEPVRGGFRDGH